MIRRFQQPRSSDSNEYSIPYNSLYKSSRCLPLLSLFPWTSPDRPMQSDRRRLASPVSCTLTDVPMTDAEQLPLGSAT